MIESYSLYRAESNSYKEYTVVFGTEPKSSDIDYQKIVHIGRNYPKYILSPEGKHLEIDMQLPPLDGLSEIIFQIEGNMIIRIFTGAFISQIPDLQIKTTEATENSLSSL